MIQVCSFYSSDYFIPFGISNRICFFIIVSHGPNMDHLRAPNMDRSILGYSNGPIRSILGKPRNSALLDQPSNLIVSPTHALNTPK